jgi:hypothetical protein
LAAALVVAGALAVTGTGTGDAATATSIVGTWSGELTPSAGSHAPRYRFTVVVYRGERAGTWRIGARCAGRLRLEDISNGYHHYFRVAGANAKCAAPGVDCLMRSGAHMVDVFVSNSGRVNSSGTFRRVR